MKDYWNTPEHKKEFQKIAGEALQKFRGIIKKIEGCSDGGVYAETYTGKIIILKPCSGSHQIPKEKIYEMS